MITFDEALVIAEIYGYEEEVFFLMDELAVRPADALISVGIYINKN